MAYTSIDRGLRVTAEAVIEPLPDRESAWGQCVEALLQVH
jgi:hypothetical protein